VSALARGWRVMAISIFQFLIQISLHDVRVRCEATITAGTVRHDQVLWIAHKPFSCNAVETGF